MAPVAQFADALKKGLGRAMLLLRAHRDDAEFEAALLQACIVDQVFDWQCESNRTQYIYDLICESGKRDLYQHILAQHLFENFADLRNRDQIFSILCAIARDESSVDRKSLWNFVLSDRFFEDDAEISLQSCLSDLVWLDGCDAFLFVVHNFESFLAQERWCLQNVLDVLAERDGVEDAAHALQQARSAHPALDRLLSIRDAMPPDVYEQLQGDGLSYHAMKAVLRKMGRNWFPDD